MTYTAITPDVFRQKAGSNTEKLCSEFSLVDAEIDVHKSKFVDLTASMVSSTNLAANGADLASGTDAIYYAVFIPPVNITAVKMHYYLTEAYVKDTTDAKIMVVTEADTPVTIFTKTLAAAGEAVRSFSTDLPEADVANITAGTALNLSITATSSSSGTGRAKVWLEYVENHA